MTLGGPPLNPLVPHDGLENRSRVDMRPVQNNVHSRSEHFDPRELVLAILPSCSV